MLPMRMLVILASLLPSIVRFGYSPEAACGTELPPS